jgi:protein TonB
VIFDRNHLVENDYQCQDATAVSFLARYGSFLIPSLMIHGVIFSALASVRPDDESALVRTVEFTLITELGGGRPGHDEDIGDAEEPKPETEREIFKKVAPEPKKARKPLAVAPAPTAKEPNDKETSLEAADEGTDAQDAEASSGGGASTVSGSAGRDPNATGSGSGLGGQGVDRRSALRAWIRQIQREVNKLATRNYPRTAVRMGLEGRLRLALMIGKDGTIRSVRLLTSSGHAVLDEAASEAVMRIRVPAPPAELQWTEREIPLPIRYSLN